jgi:acyl-coenzyme A synthetase/AMP-(fatty) acid ligase
MSDDVNWLAPDTNSTFEIVDENGTQCPIGEEGELRVLLRDIDTTSYLDDEETSRKVFREGYFYPGDIAVRRADGRIRILGRSADVLNIAVAPIEQKIREFLGVSAVCVLYFSNSRDGKEELVLAIEANKPPPKPQLDRVAHAFRSFDRLRFAILLELPRAEAGTQKIKRNEVRKIIVGKGARAGGRPN